MKLRFKETLFTIIFTFTFCLDLAKADIIPSEKRGNPEKSEQQSSKSDDESNKIVSFEKAAREYPRFPWNSFHTMAATKWSKNALKNARIQVLKGGFSSDALFKINISSHLYVLRFIGQERPLKTRRIIIQSSRWAGENGFAPKIQFTDTKTSLFMLMDFAEGRTLTLKDTQNKEIIKAIGSMLSKIHNAPLPQSDFQTMSQFTIGQDWYNSVKVSSQPFGPSVLKEAYIRWSKLNTEVQRPLKISLLHNDPNLRNILWHNGKVTFLDWELSGIEDPRKELAHVCAWYGLNQELTKVLLSSYLGREPTPKELELNEKMRKMILLEFAWVGLSSLKKDHKFDQKTWDRLYEEAKPKTVEDLSITQMNSQSKPSDETLINLFLGLIKQFIISTST